MHLKRDKKGPYTWLDMLGMLHNCGVNYQSINVRIINSFLFISLYFYLKSK